MCTAIHLGVHTDNEKFLMSWSYFLLSFSGFVSINASMQGCADIFC